VNTYFHDGTPEGFLSALLAARGQAPADVRLPATGRAEPELFAIPVAVTADSEKARALLDNLASRHGPEVPRRLMYLYYSESPRAGSLALAYLDLLELWGAEADRHLTHPVMRSLMPLCQKVGREIHRLKGLLRFTEMDPPVLQAHMEPDYNILMPVAFHFRRRLGALPWLMVDVRRKRAAHWDTRQLCFVEVDVEPAGRTPPDEMARLWQTFYRAVAIPDRKNEALRRQHMPERYWKYLAEF
jgi:probable DNA metabolism protein